MQPIHFGPSARALFGVYHPPCGSRQRDEGVVCCMPVGHEYMRAYRAMRQLAELLAADGFHVLRFDYSATGDSALAAASASTEAWREDVRTACQELRDMGGLDRLSLVGLRYGAMLAAQATAADRDIRALVLWDPVVSGRAYLDTLVTMDAARRRLFGSGAGRPPRGGERPDGDDLMGYALSPALRADLAAAELTPLLAARRGLNVLVASVELPAYRQLQRDLEHRDSGLEVRVVADTADWEDVRKAGGALFPGLALQAVVAGLRGDPV